MKQKLSIGILLLCLSIGVQAQSGKEKLEAAEREAADERERSLGGKRTANYLKDDQGKVQAAENESGDSTATASEQTEDTQAQGEGESGQSVGDDDGNGLMNANEEDSNQANNSIGNTPDEEKTSTPAVIQQTSSESGSPSVISKDDGKGRDGTGNVQRATPNMVGSPVPANWNLADKNVNPSNSEAGTQVRQQEEQPSRIGPDREDTGAQGKGDAQTEQKGTKAGENTQAGPADAQVEKDQKPSKQDERKERRKNRRDRDKDS